MAKNNDVDVLTRFATAGDNAIGLINRVDDATAKFQPGKRQGSIIDAAKKNTFEFPVFVSNSITMDYAEATVTLLEQIYAAYLQMAVSINPVVDADSVKRGVVFAQYKTDTNKYIEYTDTSYQHDACHAVYQEGGYEFTFDMLSINDHEARLINEALDYQPLSEFEHFFQEAAKKPGIEYKAKDQTETVLHLIPNIIKDANGNNVVDVSSTQTGNRKNAIVINNTNLNNCKVGTIAEIQQYLSKNRIPPDEITKAISRITATEQHYGFEPIKISAPTQSNLSENIEKLFDIAANNNINSFGDLQNNAVTKSLYDTIKDTPDYDINNLNSAFSTYIGNKNNIALKSYNDTINNIITSMNTELSTTGNISDDTKTYLKELIQNTPNGQMIDIDKMADLLQNKEAEKAKKIASGEVQSIISNLANNNRNATPDEINTLIAAGVIKDENDINNFIKNNDSIKRIRDANALTTISNELKLKGAISADTANKYGLSEDSLRHMRIMNNLEKSNEASKHVIDQISNGVKPSDEELEEAFGADYNNIYNNIKTKIQSKADADYLKAITNKIDNHVDLLPEEETFIGSDTYQTLKRMADIKVYDTEYKSILNKMQNGIPLTSEEKERIFGSNGEAIYDRLNNQFSSERDSNYAKSIKNKIDLGIELSPEEQAFIGPDTYQLLKNSRQIQQDIERYSHDIKKREAARANSKFYNTMDAIDTGAKTASNVLGAIDKGAGTIYDIGTLGSRIKEQKLKTEKLENDLKYADIDRANKRTETLSKVAVKAPQYIDDGKCLKLNTMKPLLMQVSVNMLNKDDSLQPLNYIIGVKAHTRVVPASILPEVAKYPLKEMDKLSRKIKWRAGELKFFKDLIFRIKEKKQTAADSRDPNRKWYRRLYELAHMKGDAPAAAVVRGKSLFSAFIRDKQGKGDLYHGMIPNASIIISQADVNNIKNQTDINLLKASAAKTLCGELFLMSFVIIDTDAESIKILLPDLHSDFDVHSLASVNKQLATLDTAGTKTRDMFKLLK